MESSENVRYLLLRALIVAPFGRGNLHISLIYTSTYLVPVEPQELCA